MYLFASIHGHEFLEQGGTLPFWIDGDRTIEVPLNMQYASEQMPFVGDVHYNKNAIALFGRMFPLSAEEIGRDHLGVSVDLMHRWHTGTAMPSVDDLGRIYGMHCAYQELLQDKVAPLGSVGRGGFVEFPLVQWD